MELALPARRGRPQRAHQQQKIVGNAAEQLSLAQLIDVQPALLARDALILTLQPELAPGPEHAPGPGHAGGVKSESPERRYRRAAAAMRAAFVVPMIAVSTGWGARSSLTTRIAVAGIPVHELPANPA